MRRFAQYCVRSYENPTFFAFFYRSGSISHFFLPRNTAKRVLAALARSFAQRKRDLILLLILLPIYSAAENYDNRLLENAHEKTGSR